MAPIRLCLVAPLADSNTTVTFTLHRWLHSHKGLFIRLTSAGLLSRLSGGGDQRPFSRLQVLKILVNNLARFLLAFLYQLVGELLTTLVALVLLLLLPRGTLLFPTAHHRDSLFASGRVCGHIPLFVVGDVARVGYNRAHNCHNQTC